MPNHSVGTRVEYREDYGARTLTGVIKQIRFDNGNTGPFKYSIKPDEIGKAEQLVTVANVVRALPS